MRRFILIYQREGQSIEIEGIQFSRGLVILELYPDNDWSGPRIFQDFDRMEYDINEFGDSSVKWIDEEQHD